MLNVIMISAIVLEAVFVYRYTKKNDEEQRIQSILNKCLCSVLFIVIAACAVGMKGNSRYAMFMLLGFFCSFFGDFFLALPDQTTTFILGLSSFVLAHLSYTVAFFNLHGVMWLDVGLFILVLALISGLLVKLNMQFGKMLLPCMIYIIVISNMVAKSLSLFITGVVNLTGAIILVCGTILFAVSDVVLSLIKFGDKNTAKMRSYNIITYFPGQTLMALGIYFMG